jgi:predicted TIM-barrel fold metal-dependent hydrolase
VQASDGGMKIIDTHTHLPGNALGCTPRPVAELRHEFASEGVSGAWIMTTDGLLMNPEASNDELADKVRDHRDFFTPFCTVNPNRGAAEAVAELIRANGRLGMKGLKLHPWLQAFSLTHPAVIPLLNKAGELDMPVLFHDGTPPYSTPLQIAAAAEAVPKTIIILGHAGLDDLWHDAIIACRRHPNVYLCCCSLSSGLIKAVVEQCPKERILFGSDGGFLHAGEVTQATEKLLASGADAKTLRMIFHENPRRILPQ